MIHLKHTHAYYIPNTHTPSISACIIMNAQVRKGKTELSAVGVSISAELIFSTISQHSRMKDSVSLEPLLRSYCGIQGATVVSKELSIIAQQEYVHARCSVLVCWTGQRNFQKECIELAKQLWDNNVNAEILYDSLQVRMCVCVCVCVCVYMWYVHTCIHTIYTYVYVYMCVCMCDHQMDTVGDVQDLCVKNLIRHFVMFDDLYPSKRQVQVSIHYIILYLYILIHYSCGQWRIKHLLIKR